MPPITAEAFKHTLGAADERILSDTRVGLPLREILEHLLLTAEIASGGGMLASVLLVDAEGRLRHAAAPNLPLSYSLAIDGSPIGPNAGSCGTAAHTGEPVYVADIDTDARWTDYRALAAEHCLRACWSTPIKDLAGKVIATFAIYHHTPRGPSPEEIGAIELISNSVALALQSRPKAAASAG